jgi:hypothetical protein
MRTKEKLERQLNDNPELKKQFDVWGAGIRESISKKKGILESDYTKIAEQYEAYLRKEAKILPINFEEFFSWIAKCRYPDEPFGALKIQENDFKLFHEFKERKYNTTDWNENKEWLFLNNQSQGSNPDSKGSKHKKQMNLDRLDNLMNQAFREQFDRFKSDLKEFVPNYSKMQISALASVIYDSDILHKNAKPKDFKNWQKQFCDILGVEESTYKKSNIKKEEKEKMKNTYYYLFE